MEGFELSPQQKQLWQLKDAGQSAAPNAPYRAQCTIHITGKIEPSLLKKAIENVISDHEILRTSFKALPGMRFPLQVISADTHCQFEQYDFKGLKPSEQLAQIDVLWAQAEQTTLKLSELELSERSLFQCIWVALSESNSLLRLNLPALYTDAKGFDNLAVKILNYYSACFKNSAVTDEVLQYADISEWQNQLLRDNEEDLIFSKAYWREQKIADGLNLKLPLEKQSGVRTDFNPRHLDLSFTEDQVERISAFIQQESISPTLFFLTCWQIFLWRITQTSDVIVGVESDLRQYEELQNAIGLLSKQLPLKCNLKKGLSFQDTLKNAEAALSKAYRWPERFSWDFILDAQNNEGKGASIAPFLPLGFEFIQLDQHFVDDIGFEIVKHEVCCDRFKIKLSLTQKQKDIVAKLSYDANLFSEDYIHCLVEQFKTLVLNILDHSETAIDQIELIGNVEREKLLRQFNHTECDYPKDKCLHQLFEDQAQKTPDAIAVVFEKEQLTYQQLNQKANQIAHHLQTIGVTSEVLVGICVERSLDMLVGLLGILKAGGAYVPLDPSYPAERLAYMLSDSQLPILLTQQHLRSQLPPTQAQIVCLDGIEPNLAKYASENPISDIQPNNLAYIIYTSGSTGKPKGTMIAHQGMVNYLSWAVKSYQVTEGEGATVNSSIGFDATITSLFSPLLVGKKVVLLPQEGEIEALKAALSSKTHYSLIKITPAHLEILSHLFASETVNIKTRAFVIGGEALPEKVASFWQQYAPNTRLINEYGPTETVVGCCTYEVGKQDIGKKNIPIGRPIGNTQLYILDEQQRPLPIGIAGELYIGGDGVARGYLNRPELTAERFMTLSLNDSLKSTEGPAGRLYKTGDLARYLPDGTIEYLGRIDHQVKIRGFRIELGEIETVLTAHPQIQQAVVVAREEKADNKQLVGYIVASEGPSTFNQIETDQPISAQVISEQPTAKQLRDYLISRLPDYMVPSAFVTLDSLPLTPNGKIDCKSLPAPSRELTREHPYIAPRNPVEEVIADIFTSVLNVQNIGIYDNFFELGGHSLLAFRLMSELQKKFQRQLPLATLFQSPTIEQLARVISADSSQQPWSHLVPLQPQGSLTPLFLIGGAGGNVLYLKDLAQSLGNQRPLYALQAQGLDGMSAPLQSLPEIAAQYIEAIQTVQAKGPYLLAGHSLGGKIAYEMGIQLEKRGESVAFIGILDTPAPLPEAYLEQPDYGDWDNETWLASIAIIVEEMIGKKIEVSDEALTLLTEEQQFSYFQQALEKVGFLPANSGITLVRGLVDVYKTQSLIQYLPDLSGQASSLPITLFCARDLSSGQQNDFSLLQNPTWGWEQFSDQAVEVRSVSGNHISMMRAPHVKGLADALNQALLKSQNSSSQNPCQALLA
ncbi:MAG: amino acid adenylation domain-containing protein [Cyanobacteria bacterium P01_F01_bin.86]